MTIKKNKHMKSKTVWAEAEGDERTHRTERKEWIREELDEDMLDLKNE